MIGARYFGLRGAVAAVKVLMAIPLVLVLLLALVYGQYGPIRWWLARCAAWGPWRPA